MAAEEEDPLMVAVQKLGDGSRFLWVVFLLVITPTVFNGMHSMAYIFTAEVPSHWCKIHELSHANWTDDQIRNISSATPCTKYDYNYSDFASMGFKNALKYKQSNPLPREVHCYERSFADDIVGTSYVVDWDLVCERTADRSSTHMALSLGKLVGSGSSGIYSDKYGRKITYAMGIVMMMISGPAGAIFPWYWAFMISRFFCGFAHAWVQYPSFTTLSEIAGPKPRQWMGVAYNCGYASGIALVAGVAYVFPDWRACILAQSLPALILVLHIIYMPESPRWLISQGRRREAQEMLAKEKEITFTGDPVNWTPPRTANQEPPKEEDPKERGLGLLVRHPELRIRTIITTIAWFVSSLSYYALALNVGNISADRYTYVIVMGLTEIPAYMVPTPILIIMGRRIATAVMYSLSAVFLLIILLIPKEFSTVIMLVALFGRFTLSAVFSIMILYSSELFPTVSRNSAIGVNSTMAHVGSVLAPYVADLLGALIWWGPTTLCGALSLLTGLLCATLPETANRRMSNTLEEEMAPGRRLVSLRNVFSL